MTTLSLDDIRELFRSELKTLLSNLDNKPVLNSDERLTRKQVCALYKISYPTLHSCMSLGLAYEKIGRKTLFNRSEVDQFFKKRGNREGGS